MAGRVHLGTEGEAAAAEVLAAWEVGSGFECCAVVSEYPAALAELKARLQEKSERLYTLEPDARFREDGLHALAAKLAMAKTRAVVWLEQDPFDEAAWRSALSALNQDRSWLRSQCPALFVLAGPPALFDLAEVNAPDLWSIVSPKRAQRSPRLDHGGRPPALAASLRFAFQGNRALGPARDAASPAAQDGGVEAAGTLGAQAQRPESRPACRAFRGQRGRWPLAAHTPWSRVPRRVRCPHGAGNRR